MINQKVTVSVIVPIRNEERYIAACLQSLINQTYPPDAYEVLVVDGRSSDRSRQIVEELGRGAPRLHCLDNPAAIAPAAMNIGIRHASGEFIVRADGHTHLSQRLPRELCEVPAEEPEPKMSEARVEPYPPMIRLGSRMVAAILTNPFGVGDSRFRTSNFEGFVDTVPFGAFRRDLFDRVGMYDEKLVRNQDNELNARIREAGGKIYQTPALTTEYHPVASVAELLKQTYKTSQWHIFSMRQNASSMGLRHFVPAAFVLVLAGLLAGALWNRMSLVGLGVLLVAYFATGFYFAFRRSEDRDVLLQCALPPVCLIFHIAYGLGTIAGLRYLFVAPPSVPIRAGQAVNPG